MNALSAGVVHFGLLFDQSLLNQHWFSILATFVTINTVMYVVLGVIKVLPTWPRRLQRRGRSRRSETRSIYPDAPE